MLAAGRAERLDHADVQGRAGRQDRRDRALSGARDRRALLALRVADQPRSRISRRCRSRIRRYYATYLAKRVGAYSTLGLAEDTWALNESVTSDATFLQQAYDIDRERQTMFFSALDRLKRGTVVCVFDATDRIQHMFWRYIEHGHPAAPRPRPGDHKHAIRELYKRNDALVGEVMSSCGQGDVLMVLSDHGFSSFRRGVNLNAWLLREGYLALKSGADGSAEWLRDVDWSRTRAYCLGLTGHVPERARPRGAGHRRARRRGAGAQGRDHARS